MTHDPHDPDDRGLLPWQAFCYLAGDLDPAEAAAFEARLADDQAAREAVAQAVELVQAIAAAESQLERAVVPASRSCPAWRSRLAWVAIGGLATWLFVWLLPGPFEAGWQGRRGGLDRPRELAAAWMETRRQLDATGEMGDWLHKPAALFEAEEGLLAERLANELELELDDDPMAETPSWMTAAVFSLARQGPAEWGEVPPGQPARSDN